MEKKTITVTSPLIPPLDNFIPYLRNIWDNKLITNNGPFHQKLENALCEYLGVEYLSLFTNGTLPLLTALQVLQIKGEVITSPFSFVATSHSIWWNGLVPVFVDIDPHTGNIDPNKIEQAVNAKTTAIMPVHVYGNPCDDKRISEIAQKFGLKVIYDAAHAFGVKRGEKSVLLDGDLSTLSFHATKVFNTVEGGALICHDPNMKKEIDYLKNFGFAGETEVVAPGINSKMDEIRSAYGLLNLKFVDEAIYKRKIVSKIYRDNLKSIEGISFFSDFFGIVHNYSYFPIFIDKDIYGKSRDELYFYLQSHGIYGRRYFYPLISSFTPYRNLESAKCENLPNAIKMAESVICLPLHHILSNSDVLMICELIRNFSFQ